jgi:hypothetical protein
MNSSMIATRETNFLTPEEANDLLGKHASTRFHLPKDVTLYGKETLEVVILYRKRGVDVKKERGYGMREIGLFSPAVQALKSRVKQHIGMRFRYYEFNL